MFEKATRLKIRFNYKGLCTVDDLWDIPLRGLDAIFKELNKKIKTQEEENLLGIKTVEDKILDIKINLVKYIVGVKLAEKEDREFAADKKEKKQKILSVIAEKKDKALYEMPVEDLEKMINDLG